MTERIDHAKAADELMRKLASAPAADDALDVEWGFREAQVHATLALVEQQRIANLLAWVEVDEENGIDARFKRNLYRTNIKKALGLS